MTSLGSGIPEPEMAQQIRSYFPQFEGFECFFYEGVFTVYEDPGATGSRA